MDLAGESDSEPWERVRSLYLAGYYEPCRQMLEGVLGPRAQLWLARIEGRSGRKAASLERLLTLQPEDERIAAERDVWMASAYFESDQFDLSQRLLDRALQVFRPPEEMYFRALHIRALAFFLAGDYEAAWEPTSVLLTSPHPIDRAQGYSHRSWLFAKRDLDLRSQLRDLTTALEIYEQIDEPDQFTFVRTLNSLAILCREIPTEGIIERVRRNVCRTLANEATAFPLFQMRRLLGWFDALQGDEMAALRQWKDAEALAPTEFWRVFPLVDRAYLAAAMGRKSSARELLAAADRQASRLSWSETRDEERLILLTIAQLFVAEDPARAQRYLAMFRSLRTQADARMGFVNDPRAKALQAYPHGIALVQLGELDAGVGMLEQAWEIFTRFEYGWRAALAALEIYKATGEATWLERAREQAAPWPKSWIARDVLAQR